MLKKLMAAFSGNSPAPRGSKITVGCGAVHHFIRLVHRDGIDRGAVASFGNTFTVEQAFTPQKGEVAGALLTVEQKVLSGKREGTALYDSIVQLGHSFAVASYERPAVGVVIAVTDGMDVNSRKFKDNPVSAGVAYSQLIRAAQNPIYTFLIGVGSDREIDRGALNSLASAGQMQLITVDNMSRLGEILSHLGTQLTSGTITRVVQAGNYAIAAQQRVAQLSVIPYDYAILMDRSGSMTDSR